MTIFDTAAFAGFTRKFLVNASPIGDTGKGCRACLIPFGPRNPARQGQRGDVEVAGTEACCAVISESTCLVGMWSKELSA
jgi:hypothetical protein